MSRLIWLLALLTAVLVTGCSRDEPPAVGGELAMRRLTAEQYRNAIEDAFGSRVTVAGRFEPEKRTAGLNAIGTAQVSVTAAGLEQFEAMARDIAAQAVAEQNRDALPCAPADATGADASCSRKTLATIGRSLLRRPLQQDELAARADIADRIAAEQNDFYAGLKIALSSLLVSPDFLFRIEQGTPVPTEQFANRLELTDFTLATRLSYFLWNRGPDEELLAVAERGELTDPTVLEAQLDRMLQSEHLADGVRAFFEDMLMFDQFDNIGKDVKVYPIYNRDVAVDAREQTLRFLVDHLVTERGGYPGVFTSTALPMSRPLGPIYGLPVRVADGWEDGRMPAGQARAGLLSHASINMLNAHPGRSSATLRGVFVREALLCQTIPEAPADVDFTQFSSAEQQHDKTARERLAIHSTEASCEKCHRLTDPIGLGLELFDGIGRFRTREHDKPIDPVSDFDGKTFNNPAELGQLMAQSELANACLVEKIYKYAVGREQTNRERALLRYFENRFEEVQFIVPELMRAIVLSEGFRTATAGAQGAGKALNEVAVSGDSGFLEEGS